MLKPVFFNTVEIGKSAIRDGALFFFGNRAGTREVLAQAFPDFSFRFLRQVHGHLVVESSAKDLIEADGHFTNSKNCALVIQAADCLPILLRGRTKILALHAGWRGLENHIIGSAAKVEEQVSIAAIGPHIRASSFEVGREVSKILEPLAPEILRKHPNPDKDFVDLEALANHQLHGRFGKTIEILHHGADTYTSPDFHSYRGGKATSERNYSFVALI